MSEPHKQIEMHVTMAAAGKTYNAHGVYSVPVSLATQLVREGSARLWRPAPPEPSKSWRSTVRPGDIHAWQVTVELPHLIKPRIFARFETERGFGPTRRRKRYLDEVGGDGPSVSPAQDRAVDYLIEHEEKLCRTLLGALARYADERRSAWALNDRIAPRRMTAEQVSQRVEFRTVHVHLRSRGGMAYLVFNGECAWDREHGFCAVVHGQRIVAVLQQGTGWADRRPAKRPTA